MSKQESSMERDTPLPEMLGVLDSKNLNFHELCRLQLAQDTVEREAKPPCKRETIFKKALSPLAPEPVSNQDLELVGDSKS